MVRRAASIVLPMWPIDLIRRRQRERFPLPLGEGPPELGVRARTAVREDSIKPSPQPSPRGRGIQSPHRHIATSSNPILIIALERGVQIVQHRCELAAHAGVVPGMTLAHARALLDDSECQIVEHDPLRDGQSLHKLAIWAQRFSPMVAVDAPDGLLIDITGCEKVFGGEERLAQRMIHDLNRLGFHARVAIASTFACAWGRARWKPQMNADEHRAIENKQAPHDNAVPGAGLSSGARAGISIVPSGHERAALAPLPLRALRLDQTIIDALHEIEIIRVGQLFDLPRAQLADRYGEELLLHLDQALGEGGAFEVIDPVRLQDPPRVAHVFDGPVLQIEGVELMTRLLLGKLIEHLLKLERGICRLDVEFTRIDAPPMRFSIRLSHPSRNVKHIWSLLKPKIEKINLGFGVEEIALVASRSRILAHAQEELKPQIDADAHRWNEHCMILSKIHRGGRCPAPDYHPVLDSAFHATQAGELIDTLCNRLGAQRVLRVERRESHVPERSVRFCSALDPEPLAPGSAGGAVDIAETDRPTLLLSRPELITIECDDCSVPCRMTWLGIESAIITCIGPEAIASEWWKESPSGLREYYKVQDQWGTWLWMYFEQVSRKWFMHGVWA
jgi:protein ImuB